MLKQILVTVSIVVSSFFMDQFYLDLFVDGFGNTSTDTVFFTIAAGFLMSFGAALMLAGLSIEYGWRGWFRALTGMGFQVLTVLAHVAIQSPEISAGFLVHAAVIAVVTAFLFAAVLFAPKEKPASQTASA